MKSGCAITSCVIYHIARTHSRGQLGWQLAGILLQQRAALCCSGHHISDHKVRHSGGLGIWRRLPGNPVILSRARIRYQLFACCPLRPHRLGHAWTLKVINVGTYRAREFRIHTEEMYASISYVQVLKGSLSSRDKASAIYRFSHDPRCTILLMDATGAVGLDLSFVEYVFLMEPLADEALEQQIISRAFRLGARKTVHVEVLVMPVCIPRSKLVIDAIL
jgi:hypothetical protein